MYDKKRITYTFVSGKLSCCLVIPIKIARSCGLDKPVPVVIEEREGGIFIRKLKEDY